MTAVTAITAAASAGRTASSASTFVHHWRPICPRARLRGLLLVERREHLHPELKCARSSGASLPTTPGAASPAHFSPGCSCFGKIGTRHHRPAPAGSRPGDRPATGRLRVLASQSPASAGFRQSRARNGSSTAGRLGSAAARRAGGVWRSSARGQGGLRGARFVTGSCETRRRPRWRPALLPRRVSAHHAPSVTCHGAVVPQRRRRRRAGRTRALPPAPHQPRCVGRAAPDRLSSSARTGCVFDARRRAGCTRSSFEAGRAGVTALPVRHIAASSTDVLAGRRQATRRRESAPYWKPRR